MTSAAWHARISCGRDTGAGFLVTERHVLTCAHVVARSGTDAVSVSFAHGGGESIGAHVVAHGGWDGRDTDAGDLAVLELDRAVDLKPAEFAAPDEAYGHPPRKLLAYGFPKHYDEGTIAEYRATAGQLIAGEWVQLEAWAAHGQPLVPGFSGAAVTLADSGRVVGMVSAAARDPGVRNGRMLPANVMARYWPRLGDLIPTPDYDGPQKERLRLLVEEADRHGDLECSPRRLYQEAVTDFGPPPPPQGFASLWDAAWYLLSEVSDTKAAVRFAERLADFVEDRPTRAALRSWPHVGAEAAPGHKAGVTPHSWSPILVEIAPSGSGDHQFLVEVSAYNGDHRRVVGRRRMPADRVRSYALERIDEAYHALEPGARELLAFVLPRRWLNTDVANWQRSADDDSPLGAFAPLVVMDLERRRSGGLQHKLLQKWRELDVQRSARLRRIGCGTVGQDPGKLTVALRRGADVVGFGTPPRTDGSRQLFKAGLNAAVPVMLWPRSGCRGGPSHEDCRGAAFLDRLAEHLADLPPAELPTYIHELRETAYASESSEHHWAYDLALLWEDPRCLPDPVGYQHSPVG
ncbi:VMAP-C domain-containing protein [Streptomyces spongiae]|uniref:Trypsin-like peptidase domain-containing protein n=1 Tax=Streptomyces spongiae TaxID=565072 RepID=A0A5N8XZ75_9ACTN|nr:trypsin-like peptidase domain-containing protein [Streptomyces spongiae]MPY64657.1 trypsin-like peptidase domain-containing protein [Streptomyces spongiae]